MMNMFLTATLSMSIVFMCLSHPLSLGMILLVQTFLIAMITGMLNYNFWFSYVLFLIMVGGMLILFIYMTSVASNEKFKFSLKMLTMMVIPLLIMSTLNLADKMITNMKLINNETSPNKAEMLSLTKYMNFPNNTILIMIIIYLLITLIMVVKITNISKGPLRQMF